MTTDKQLTMTKPSANLTIDSTVQQTKGQRIYKEHII